MPDCLTNSKTVYCLVCLFVSLCLCVCFVFLFVSCCSFVLCLLFCLFLSFLFSCSFLPFCCCCCCCCLLLLSLVPTHPYTLLKQRKSKPLNSPNMTPSFTGPLLVQCAGELLSGSLADAPQGCFTSEASSPRTVLIENICKSVQQILRHMVPAW